MKKWVSLHQHTDESNAGGYFEVVTKYTDYIDYAIDHQLPAVCITNHGNVARWVKHKEMIEEAGMKYIHGIEAYVCMNLEDRHRGYHTILIAKNWEGVKEINRLSSASFNRKDGHFYYKPRILFEDLVNTSDNIIVTTACLASGLWQNYPHKNSQTNEMVEGNKEVFDKWVKFAVDNKERVYLEVQPHLDQEQRDYNHLLLDLSNVYGLKIVAANDIHALNKRHNDIRLLIKRGKGSEYDGDDEFELWCKDYSEMLDSFDKQGVLTRDQAESALDMTMEIVDEIEEFELDRSHKYPHMFENEEETFQKAIKDGLKKRGILSKPPEERKKYLDRIKHEYKTYKANGSISYMLADWTMVKAAHEMNIPTGYGRGSVSGSLIAYLLGQTEMDSVKLDLNFERFMNIERVSLADIDRDYAGEDKITMQKWLLEHPQLHCASIMTANTYGIKGAIKVIAKGHPDYSQESPFAIQAICNQIDEKGNYPNSLYEEHKALFDMAMEIEGVIDSFGRHACGIVVSSDPIDDVMGTQTVKDWDYPVTQIYMKEIDGLNFTKFDVLGLDNLGLIAKTCELVGLPFLTPDSEDIVDFQDEKVWKSMVESNIGIFQFEGERAGSILRHLFSDKTLSRIKAKVPDIKYIDLLSLANAAQRPSGASYLQSVTDGLFNNNGHEALNEFLSSTLGNLVYQEQQTKFLVDFCNWTVGHADIIRRGIGKKLQSIFDNEVPKIKPSFIKTMVEKYGDTQEHAEEIADRFITVFMDSANYGFSINHSMAYSYIGYIATWLRYYYPLEFCTAAYEIWKDDQDKINKITEFALEHDIQVKPPKFRKSKGLFFMDKESNTIYEGTAPIKGNNAAVGDALFSIKDRKHESFTRLLLDINDLSHIVIDGEKKVPLHEVYEEWTDEQIKELDKCMKGVGSYSVEFIQDKLDINKTKLTGLILLNYFEEFGKPKKLLSIYEKFQKDYKRNNKTFAGKAKKYQKILEFEWQTKDEDFSLMQTMENEFALTGRCTRKDEKLPAKFAFVTEVKAGRNKTRATVYSVRKGVTSQIHVGARNYRKCPFQEGDLISIDETEQKPRSVFVDGRWTKHPTEKELWVNQLKYIRKGSKSK